ncbi:MAG TPA: hypothetical protein VFW50_08330 [Streptosporangiaceae bacterium]|nr:hypothetical protein [Streptosporangiaceae bacterium]
MTDTAGPKKVASADQIGLSHREATAAPAMPAPRDAASWARNVWHNSMVRSVLQTLAAPVTSLRRTLKHGAVKS